ncbi:hypothetical protein EV360DRAFT_69742 [Lentinula raphanica]|nr:hypothetical protein EV360DRAFT_69742 [Lentinula raphanica]
MPCLAESITGSSRDTEKAHVDLPGAAELPKTSKPSSDDSTLNTTSDPLQVAAQQYPWMHMASTLDACFNEAEEKAKKDIQARSDALDAQEANLSDERTRSEAERLIEFYGELSSDKFAKDAPKIMQTFLSHGNACADLEAEALRIASQDLDSIDFDTVDIMVPLREYNDVLDRLATTSTSTESSAGQQFAASNSPNESSSNTQAAFESEDNSPSDLSGSLSQSAAARSQIAPVFQACLPIIRARVQNITMAQQLVEGAKQNLSMTIHLQSLGLGNDDDHSEEEEEED